MKRGFEIFGYGVFIFVLVLLASFVIADSGSLALSTAEAGDNVKMLWFNVSNVTGVGTGNASLDNITVNLIGTASAGNVTNITLSDGSEVWFNDTSGSFPKVITINKNITQELNFTLNFTLSTNATWNKTFQANVTAIGNSTTNENHTVVFSALPYNSSLVTIDESTAPTVTAVEKESNTRDSITTDFTSSKCSDSGEAASGISTCVLSSSSGTVDGAKITGLSCGTSYDITVTATDKATNTASKTASLSTQACGGGGTAVPQLPKKSHLFTQVNPGVPSIMGEFDSEIGVREITINVDNPAQDVKITVTKHDGKPAAVSVEKSGSVYQYLQIESENLDSGFGDAVVEFKVEKSWMTSNGLERDDIAAFRFDESASSWNELETTYSGNNADYNYYSVELDSFSYFAVSEKSFVDGTDGETEETDTEETDGAEKNRAWLWILIAVIVVVAAAYFGTKSRKK